MEQKEKHTVGDVAKLLGVSRATVSRALSGAPGVGPKLREKIIAFSEEIGYKPNSIARGLSKGRMDIIGLVFGDVRNPFYADLTFSIQKTLEQAGYTVMLFNSEYIAEKEMQFLQTAKDLCLAGLILFTAQNDIKKDQFDKLNIPVVFVNRTLNWPGYDSVMMDNFKAGYMAAMHLIELGHKRIGFVSGQSISSASSQRFEGFCQALKNYYLPLEETDCLRGDLTMETGYALAKEFAARSERPSAMVVANDLMALGFMDGCAEADLRIPEDLSLISFDNIDFAKLRSVGLTTVSQQVTQMGETAAHLMVNRIEYPETEFRRTILEPELMIRKTTAKFSE